MRAFLDAFRFIGYVLGVLFAFWPAVLVAPIIWGLQRRGNVRWAMMVAWAALFVGWLAFMAAGLQPSGIMIHEPLNTYLFFLVGLALIAWTLGAQYLGRRGLHRTADTARKAEDLLDISPTQFENMVVEYYRLIGYRATRTGTTGDHGVDVVVNTPRGEKWVVQCKKWRGWVGEPEARDFYGTMNHEKADRGILVTTGTFSKAARTWAKGKPLALVDGEEFLRTWKKAKKATTTRQGKAD